MRDCPQKCFGPEVVARDKWAPDVPAVCNAEVTKAHIASAHAYNNYMVERCQKGDTALSAELRSTASRTALPTRGTKCVFQDPYPAKQIVLHHSETPQDSTAQSVRDMHIRKGWTDVGYHYVVAKDASGQWKIYEGRKRATKDGPDKCKWMVGAHVGEGANLGSVGIVVVGNYTTEQHFRDFGEPPGPALLGDAPPPAGPTALVMQLVNQLRKDCPSIKTVRDITMPNRRLTAARPLIPTARDV
jgi:hypothetical protein